MGKACQGGRNAFNKLARVDNFFLKCLILCFEKTAEDKVAVIKDLKERLKSAEEECGKSVPRGSERFQ